MYSVCVITGLEAYDLGTLRQLAAISEYEVDDDDDDKSDEVANDEGSTHSDDEDFNEEDFNYDGNSI